MFWKRVPDEHAPQGFGDEFLRQRRRAFALDQVPAAYRVGYVHECERCGRI